MVVAVVVVVDAVVVVVDAVVVVVDAVFVVVDAVVVVVDAAVDVVDAVVVEVSLNQKLQDALVAGDDGFLFDASQRVHHAFDVQGRRDGVAPGDASQRGRQVVAPGDDVQGGRAEVAQGRPDRFHRAAGSSLTSLLGVAQG